MTAHPWRPFRNSQLTSRPRHSEQCHPQADQEAVMVPRRERHRVRLHHGHARGCPELHRPGTVPLPAGCLRVSLTPFRSFKGPSPLTGPPFAKPGIPGPASSQPRLTSPRRTTSHASFRSASAPFTARGPYPAPSPASSPPPSHRWTGSAAMRDGDGYSSLRA